MALYADPASLQNLLGGPVAWGEGLAPDEAEVRARIQDNGELIDGFCRDRYTVPFDPVPRLIRAICVDLCLADLLPIIFHRNDEQLTRGRELRVFALARLDRIQSGRLSVQAGDDAAEGMGGQVTWTPPTDDRLFTRDQDF